MKLESIWEMGAITYSLASVAGAGLLWAIWRRAPRGRETSLLLGSLVALALHYASMAADAFLHAGAATAPFTIWSGLGQTLASLFWAFLILFLLAVVERLQPVALQEPAEVWGLIGGGAIYSVIALFLFGWAVRDLAAGARPEVIQADLARLMHGLSGVPVLFFIVTPGALLKLVFERVPREDRTNWMYWTVGHEQGLISLGLTEHPPIQASNSGSFSVRDLKALSGIVATALVLLTIFLLDDVRAWKPLTLGFSLLFHLLLLPSMMGLVYYQARFSFFDVVLKRGLLFVTLASLVGAGLYIGRQIVWRPGAPSREAAVCVAATLFVWLAASLFERADRILDRIIFHRPNYRTGLQSIFEEMARCPNPETLAATVTAGLTRTLGAEFVRYGLEPARPGSLAVRIGAPERTRGYLSLGPRNRGQQYRSEDLNFLDAVAAQFAGLLESFDARQSEHLATTAELRALRAQINPHFLFNALNTLAEMARGNPATERAILNLSRVFRYALDSTRRETAPLSEEIAAVRSYLEIEKERFEDKLKFEIDVPEDLLSAPVPPMLIQPLVENALKHGIAPKLEGGTVRIAAAQKDGRLRVTVSDDGAGFDPARAAANVGMANVRSRVEKTGGAWTVQSKPGQGTEIAFELVAP